MLIPLALALATVPQATDQKKTAPAPHEVFRAWIGCPGGEIPFGLALRGRGDKVQAVIVNEPERIEIETVSWDGKTLDIRIPPYDSTISATARPDGTLHGTWRKRRGAGEWSQLAFGARPGPAARFPPARRSAESRHSFTGRWAVQFSEDRHPSVAIFEQGHDGTVTGTFLTTLGDYRYLAGRAEGDTLRLSCFDGAHAFLFVARAQKDGSLRGDFWSSGSWHETWSARRDAAAQLPDAFALTRWTDKVPLRELRYPDPEGRLRSPAEFFGPRGLVIQVFGSWCPNCNDSSRTLGDLHRRYAAKGIGFLGLAFEHGDDLARNAAVVAQYKRRNRVDYPVLIAGRSNKTSATEAFPVLDRIRSYPTTIFLDAEGKPTAIYTGFSGPATGAFHYRLLRQFRYRIEQMLDDR